MSDVLCFLLNKYGKTQLHALRSATADFYSCDVLSSAKFQLLDDIKVVVESNVTLPHLPMRRNKSGRLAYELDDLFGLLHLIDENKLFDRLPIYVTNNLDNIPSTKLFDGDLKVIGSKLDKFEDKLRTQTTCLTNMAADFAQLRKTLAGVNEALHSGVRPQLTAFGRPGNQSGQTGMASASVNNNAIATANAYARAVCPETQPNNNTAVNSLSSWSDQVAANSFSEASAASATASGREHVGTDDTGETTDDQAFTVVASRRKRRRRQTSERHVTTPPTEQRRGDGGNTSARPADNNRDRNRGNGRRKPLMIGKLQPGTLDANASAGSRCGIAAVKPTFIRKAVYCVDNVSHSVSLETMSDFIRGLSVELLSINVAKTRRRRNDSNYEQRQAFHVIINKDHVSRFLDEDQWPADIAVSEWIFRPNGDAMDYRQGGETTRRVEQQRNVTQSSDLQPYFDAAERGVEAYKERQQQQQSLHLNDDTSRSIGGDRASASGDASHVVPGSAPTGLSDDASLGSTSAAADVDQSILMSDSMCVVETDSPDRPLDFSHGSSRSSDTIINDGGT